MRSLILALCTWASVQHVRAVTPECQKASDDSVAAKFGKSHLELYKAERTDACYFILRENQGPACASCKTRIVNDLLNKVDRGLFIGNQTTRLNAEECASSFLTQLPLAVVPNKQDETIYKVIHNQSYCFTQLASGDTGHFDVFAIRVGLPPLQDANASSPYVQFTNASGARLYAQTGALVLAHRMDLGYTLLDFYPDAAQEQVPRDALDKEAILVDWKFIWAITASAVVFVLLGIVLWFTQHIAKKKRE